MAGVRSRASRKVDEMAGADRPSPDPHMLGRILAGRYRILDFIARGGMGRVYLAEQLGLGRQVAIKLLDPRYQDDWNSAADFRKRFEKEAALAARLAHPNIVVVHDYGTDEGLYFIVMEHLEGRTLLQEVHEHGPLPAGRLVHIARQACLALGDAHRAGLIHRDLKPSNLVLLRRGRDENFLKLVDFGLVKQIGPVSREPGVEHSTRPGSMMGSPAYLSPEQVLAEQVTAASDIYSLGAVMFFMATGVPPFQETTEYELVKAHVERPPPAFRQAYPNCNVPRALEAIVAQCLAKAPGERFHSIDELETALAALGRYSARPLPALGTERSGSSDSQQPESVESGPSTLPAGPDSSLPPGRMPPEGEVLESFVKQTALRERPPGTPKSNRPWFIATATVLLVTLFGVGLALWISPVQRPVPTPLPTEAARGNASEDRATLRAVEDPGVIELTTHPAGVMLWVDGRRVGTTPIKLALSVDDAPWNFRLEKEGYVSRNIVVEAGSGRIDVALQRVAQNRRR